MSPISISAAILAGGQSKRLGGDDKSLFSTNGITFLESVYKALGESFHEIFVISNKSKKIEEMGFLAHADVIPDKGPLGGLYTALSICATQKLLLVACDMPFLDSNLVKNFILSVSNEDVFIPINQSSPEPLLAVYDRKCLPAIIDKIEREELQMTSFFSGLKVRYLEEETWRKWDVEGESFKNINTPDDIEYSEKFIERSF